MRRPPATAEQLDRIRVGVVAGLTTSEIAAQIGFHRHSVARIVRKRFADLPRSPYASKHSIPADVIRKVREGLEAGKLFKEIAFELGETLSRVTDIACRHCPDLRRVRPVTQERLDAIKLAVAQGLTYPQIGERLGLSAGTVQWTVARHIGVLERPKRIVVLNQPRKTAEPSAVAEVRRGIEAGLSYSQIGAGLGTTRNAIAGLVARHLKGVERPPREKKPVAEKAPPKPRVRKPRPTTVRPRIMLARLPSEPTPVVSAAMTFDLIPFAGASGCRWPMWSADDKLDDKRVCGVSCGSQTYCAHHVALAYRTSARRAA
ncbi:GcrA family cell cycle regulator [Aureimonas glaciei]|uniref:Uncharacterized protein n=1 Tax=Aureimonas glaciei TaxID=1776957 RepID=A0A916Y0Z9_9HYPH|nr:GcrA family cell cycle regulator [Aureimonas glaciei]GGD25951.1 hypothetical protein GCM10011335_31200 [Aureimonas glaciei]